MNVRDYAVSCADKVREYCNWVCLFISLCTGLLGKSTTDWGEIYSVSFCCAYLEMIRCGGPNSLGRVPNGAKNFSVNDSALQQSQYSNTSDPGECL